MTARALHFYEEQGLIGPITRNDAGHRIYRQVDLVRLQQISSFRLLGVPIAEMKSLLTNDPERFIGQLEQQLQRLRTQRGAIESLEARVIKLLDSLKSESVSPEGLDDLLFQILESTTMYEKYFKQSDIDEMHNQEHGENGEHTVGEAWTKWVDEMKTALRSGADTQSEEVQKLMRHWNEMVNHLAGNNEENRQKFNDLLHDEPKARQDHGIDDELFEFMAKAAGGH